MFQRLYLCLNLRRIDLASPNTNRKEKSNSADLYSTPIEAMDAIRDHLAADIGKIYSKINREVQLLEPCNGLGFISDYIEEDGVLANFPINVVRNELYDYNTDTDFKEDFLENKYLGQYDIIVTNPPYLKATEFILKGFEHAPIQWHFLRLSFLEGQKRFMDLFNLGKLSDVYLFTFRVSCPKGVEMEDSANSVAYCWYRFDKSYCGQPILHWLRK
jgi:hypothetical protein